jgi:hypothetical protein
MTGHESKGFFVPDETVLIQLNFHIYYRQKKLEVSQYYSIFWLGYLLHTREFSMFPRNNSSSDAH